MKGDKISCPICKGEGELDAPRLDTDLLEKKRRAAFLLHEAGFSYREVMRHLGYKSPRSVQLIIENKPKAAKK